MFSCKTSENFYTSSNMNSDCPEDGVCTIEVKKNKSLTLQKDKFGNLYPEVTDGEKVVLIFEYTKNKIPDTEDSSYRELVYLEISAPLKEMNLQGENLQKTKTTFARLCFCRGQTGYYIINEGDLKLTRLKKNKYNLSLEFNTDEVPQVIKNIDFDFSI